MLPSNPNSLTLFDPSTLMRLRDSFAEHFTGEAINAEIGLLGEAALGRSDLAGIYRLTRSATPTATLIRLFLLGADVDPELAARAITPQLLADSIKTGLLSAAPGRVRANVDLRPYGEVGQSDWWLMSDLSTDVGRGPLRGDHVLGVGAAGTTLAQAIVRDPVRRAADVGTGCGIQALHLARHCESVIVTDLSVRALGIAACNAVLNDMSWEFRQGSLLEPIASEQLDLVVCNPPFIVGPGFSPAEATGFSYRDSALAGDEVCARLIRGIPALLAPEGTGQLLANWAITDDEPWTDRVSGWLSGTGCDGWIWQREVVEPGEYVAHWLRDAGESSTSPSWRQRYDHWLDWFERSGVVAVGMGLVSIRRTDSWQPRVICEDLRQPIIEPIGPEIGAWFDRLAWLRAHDDAELMATRLVAAEGLVLSVQSLRGEIGWDSVLTEVRQSSGACWSLEADRAVVSLLAACDGKVPVGVLLELIAIAESGSPADPYVATVESAPPVLRDLIQRGFLTPRPV